MDFHRRFIRDVEKIPGVTRVRFNRGCSRHPRVTVSLVNGVIFDFGLRGRPIDGCSGYFNAYLAEIRRQIRRHLGELATTHTPTRKRQRKRRNVKRRVRDDYIPDEPLLLTPDMFYCGPPVPTADSPFAVLKRRWG
jgi:hypothetical protein